MSGGVLASHSKWLPVGLQEHQVSLGEGGTPLLKMARLPKTEGVELEMWAKYEGSNPTGSFKDRGMAVAVAHILSEGGTSVACASTGNTSASAAAYAAKAGLRCVVLLPAGKVATGKIAQAAAYGAKIIAIRGSFDDAMRAVRELENDGFAIVNSINPYRIQGQKTIVFEVIEELSAVPDVHALPVGNAGNITAHFIGYCEAAGMGTPACSFCGGDCQLKNPVTMFTSMPRLLGVQAAGAAPFLSGKPVDKPETVATAIRIGNPQSWQAANIAIAKTGGKVIAVADAELLRVQKALAALEGIFCEPASAAGVAGVLAEAKAGNIHKGARVVCTLTGSGLKDPEAICTQSAVVEVDADIGSIVKAIGRQ